MKRERRRRREEEREMFQENERNRVVNPFIQALGPGWPKPSPFSLTASRLIKILMNLDQSNASGALVWSGSIRCVGLGSATVGLGFPWCFSWINCYTHLFSCYLNPCALWFSYKKIPKNCYVLLDAFLIILWYFYTLRWIKNMCANFLLFDLYIFVFVKFLVWF